MRVRNAKTWSLAAIVAAALVMLGSGSASAACGQATSCTFGRLCLYPTSDLSGDLVKTVVCSVPTFDYQGCGNSCDCICWNEVTQSVWNNSAWTYRLYNGVNYPTGASNHIDLDPGDQLTCAQMGSSFCSQTNHVKSEKNLDVCDDVCTAGCPPGCGVCP